MPLIKSKSKQAFKKNVATEINTGKPQDQALAIAYETQRRTGKKMADGGEVADSEYDPYKKDFTPEGKVKKEEPQPEPSPAPSTIVEAIMQRRKMAQGGMVTPDDPMDQLHDEYNALNDEAIKKENYDEEEEPFIDIDESNLDEPDDMFGHIRKKMAAKRG